MVHLLYCSSLLTNILLSIQLTRHTTNRVIIKNANLTHFIPQNKSLMEEYTWLFRENAYFLPWYARVLLIWAPLTFILLSCYISFFWVPISSDSELYDILDVCQAFSRLQAFVLCLCFLKWLFSFVSILPSSSAYC